MGEKSPKEQILHQVYVTATSRFVADKRLSRSFHRGMWTVTLLSLFLIFISLVDLFYQGHYQNVAFMQIFLSVFSLVYAMYLNMTQFSVRADRFHNSGKELMVLYRRCSSFEKFKVLDIEREYSVLLDKCENHDNIRF